MDNSGSISLVSVNCGLPRQVPWHGGNVTTAIYKEPVKGRVAVRTLNLDGDRQADLSVHIGDRFTVGSAQVVVTQPRLPCYKLGLRFETDVMVKRFLASGRTGFYLKVIREGDVGAGEKMVMTYREPSSVPLPWILRLYVTKHYSREDIADVRRALMAPALPDSWKEYFRERLARAALEMGKC